MEIRGLTPEIQNYVKNIQEKKSQSKWLSLDDCQQLLQQAAEKKSDALSGLGYYHYAEYYWYHGDREKTMYCLTECVKYFLAAEMYEYLAKAYNMMGAVSDRKNNRRIALSYYYTGKQYAEKYHFYYAQAMAEQNIAFVLVRMKMYKEATEKYYKAIECYHMAEEGLQRKSYILDCMVECGFCHQVMNEMEQAFVLEDNIAGRLEDDTEEYCETPSIWLYFASCEAIRGNWERTGQLLDKIIDAVKDDAVLDAFLDDVVIMAALLDRIKDSERMERLMDVVTQEKLSWNLVVFLDIYPFKSRYLLRKNRMQEYVEYTKEYFKLYEQYQQEDRQVALSMLEMRMKLQRIELEQTQIRAYNQQLEKIAMYDSMTGLANRTYLNTYHAKKFDQAFLQQELFGVEMMDIDYFKQYNDTYGHLAGDGCIEAIADVLRSVQNEKVFCARYGGDEFMIIYSGMTTGEIRQVAETIQERVRNLQIPHAGSRCADYVTVSQGIFVRIPHEDNREWDFNMAADKALYEAKRAGRNCFHLRTEF